MTPFRRMAAVLLFVAVAGCGTFGGSSGAQKTPPSEPPLFMNRVWRVVEAGSVAVGTYYVFLSDNTLMITPLGAATPSLGRWHFAGGGIVLIEEGYRYPADILESGPDRFSIRVHRAEESEDVVMVAVR